MATKYYHQTVSKKAPKEEFIRPQMAGSRASSLVVGACEWCRLASLLLRALKTVPVISKWLTYPVMSLFPGRSQDSTPDSPQRQQDHDLYLFLYQNKTILTFSSCEKAFAAFDLPFCQLESTNVVINILQVKSFPSMFMGMTRDQWHF